jgi:hypothetical protein
MHRTTESIQEQEGALSSLKGTHSQLVNSEPLSQLYPIYSDNHYAFINGEPISWNHLHPLFEITTLLASRFQVKEWVYNSATMEITFGTLTEEYRTESQRKTIAVLHLLANAVGQLWR